MAPVVGRLQAKAAGEERASPTKTLTIERGSFIGLSPQVQLAARVAIYGCYCSTTFQDVGWGGKGGGGGETSWLATELWRALDGLLKSLQEGCFLRLRRGLAGLARWKSRGELLRVLQTQEERLRVLYLRD